MPQDRHATGTILSVLTLLFCGRILAQLLQANFDLAALPPFEAWHSGAVPYAYLLIGQLTILGAMVAACRAVLRGARYPRLGRILLAGGSLYLAVVLARSVIGVLQLSESAWFDEPLPTAFHGVLASFVLLLGWHWSARETAQPAWRRLPARIIPALAYPFFMMSALVLFYWLTRSGIALGFAAYLSVTLGATAVLALELLLPYRKTWRPAGRTVAWDITYLAAIQVLLPGLFSFAVVSVLPWLTATLSLSTEGIWPHHWPLAAQVLLLLLIADFGRYWLHRAAHTVMPLWALHAVHHAPKELYTLNVGRFHPGDKALQFLLDSLPFILLGVGPEVLAIYFVFYGVNGFFQHCNARIRLGPLNWLISGPELHRWHHAKEVAQANCNFGNNLIIWDVIFGTRYLPANTSVGKLGISNPHYPDDLPGQTLAPFTISPDHDTARSA